MKVSRSLVAGRYRLTEPVGVGGMGRVWMARDEMLDRDVAVKEFVPPEWMTDVERDRLRTRTLREARSAARLNHPHVVRIYDVVHAENLPWIVMEYVPSRSLHQVIGEDGPIAPERAALIGLAVLDALTAAHRAGVLHRDVKPHNVLIGHDGRVVLTDFGLATFVDDGSVTGPGMVVGSPQYVSPERARDGASTIESDLWSFGATLYTAVEGRSPYARENAMATLTALATEAPDPPVLAGPLAPVLTGLLRRDPAERLTADDVRAALMRVAQDGMPSLAPAPPSPTRSSAPAGTAPTAAGRAGIPSPRPAPDDLAAPSTPAAGLGAALAAALPGMVGVHDRTTSHPGAGAPPGVGADAGAGPSRGAGAAPGVGAAPGGGPSGRTGDGPGGDGAGGAVRSDRRVHRYRLVAAGALLVAFLGGGGLLADRLGRPAGGPADRPALPPPAATSTASPGAASTYGAAGGFSPVACAATAPTGLPRTPLAAARPQASGGYALPAHWSYHVDDSGFQLAVPDGWTYQEVGATLCFRDPDGTRVLSLDTARKPTADPVAACRAEARRLTAAGVLPGYVEVGIAPVPYVTRAADWEFRYADADGTALHASTRWFAAGGRAYALGWVTREFDWQTNRSYLAMIQASFTAS